ncbi:hypothetical protein GDI0373 [Gluconacetobacter diazotrophicus PA1 5]|uniref:Uncharacterized protein n=1 Tax=Gluconacetobacter diazotrophicus (strain ATCC 49037 / DSM 5601 / CCUG 37298 / CIP 103539 / LMG 7603 / PAl5) TaxID=272568 RepID=A9H5D1_GLUDA|nr:hypothetical protein GDI0373 [Gluconacetobacter diazotrophicus PA1 5]
MRPGAKRYVGNRRDIPLPARFNEASEVAV